MEQSKKAQCYCDVRNRLITDVLTYGVEQAKINALRGGSCWGCNSNASLLTLAQYLTVMHLLSEKFDPEVDTKRVADYCKEDFCFFTSDTTSEPDASSADIRRAMKERAQRVAVPVLQAAKGSEMEGGALYQRLYSATDSICRIGG